MQCSDLIVLVLNLGYLLSTLPPVQTYVFLASCFCLIPSQAVLSLFCAEILTVCVVLVGRDFMLSIHEL